MTLSVFDAAITLFLVMDPIGNVPVFLSILDHVSSKRHFNIILRETLIALLVLLIFLFAGKKILQMLSISPAALSIAGGIVLFLIAIKMVFPIEQKGETIVAREPFIVPLAIPLIAGPSSMAVVMLLASNQAAHIWSYALPGVLIAWFASTLILLASTPLSKLFGDRGLAALERLMGLILTTLAVQMLLSGIGEYFHLAH